MALSFTPQFAPFPGQRVYGALHRGRSYVVSYTPDFGWAASYRNGASGKSVMLGRFDDYTAARHACSALAESQDQGGRDAS